MPLELLAFLIWKLLLISQALLKTMRPILCLIWCSALRLPPLCLALWQKEQNLAHIVYILQ